jgi:lipopolysaccharide export system permease protein
MKKLIIKLKELNIKFTIFDRYIINEFLKVFFATLFLVVIMNALIELIERLDFFVVRKISPLDIFIYYFYKMPYFIIQFSPVAILFATVFSLGNLNKNRELIAIISSGIKFTRVAFFLYLIGFITSLFFILFNEFCVVPSIRKAKIINNKFKNIYYEKDRSDFAMYGKNNIIYYVRYYNARLKTLQNVKIIKKTPDGSGVIYRIDAFIGNWDEAKKIWIFKNGVYREFNNNGDLIKVEEFQEKEFNLYEKPKDFEYVRTDIDEMRIKEAINYINKLKESGFKYRSELVDFNIKFSFPFSSFIMILIGAPISTISAKSVLIISMGWALLISFIYWVVLNIGVSLGKNGILPPFLATWIGNIIFIFISILIHKKISK